MFGLFILLISIFMVGVFAGYMIKNKNIHKRRIGTLRVSNMESDNQPYLFLEIDQGKLELIKHNTEILVDVEIR